MSDICTFVLHTLLCSCAFANASRYPALAFFASARHLRVSLRSVRVPCTFVAGAYDVLAASADLRTAAERIPDARYTELRGSHFLPLERPGTVHQELLDLLSRVR